MRFATVPLLLVLATACDLGGPKLEVRTFNVEAAEDQLRGVSALVQPYIYNDRPDAPGSMSVALGSITVRETPDNLDRIARVIADLDLSKTPSPSYRLIFQLIEANGSADTDPTIADVVAELRNSLKFDGYVLKGQAHIALTPSASFTQRLQTDSDEYSLSGNFDEVASGQALSIHFGQRIGQRNPSLLDTTVGIRPDQILVLGSVPAQDSAILLLVVRMSET